MTAKSKSRLGTVGIVGLIAVIIGILASLYTPLFSLASTVSAARENSEMIEKNSVRLDCLEKQMISIEKDIDYICDGIDDIKTSIKSTR